MRGVSRIAIAITIIIVVLIAGLGAWFYLKSQQAPTATSPTTTPLTTTTPAHKYSIAVVYDIGGRGDLSFNDMGFPEVISCE